MRRIILFLMTALVAGFFIGCSNIAGDKTQSETLYRGLDYFDTRPGLCMTYRVTDTGYKEVSASDDTYQLVFQDFEKGKPEESLAFGVTFFTMGSTNSSPSASVVGAEYKNNSYFFNWGRPISNQGNFLFYINLRESFSLGKTYGENRKVTYSKEPDTTVNGHIYEDCIKAVIQYSVMKPQDEYIAGEGTIIYAKGVGMIKARFVRSSDESVVTYELQTKEMLQKHTVSGVVKEGDAAKSGMCVQLGFSDWGIRSITDNDGKFSIAFYGEKNLIHVGTDKNNDSVLDAESGDSIYAFLVEDLVADKIGVELDLDHPLKKSTY